VYHHLTHLENRLSGEINLESIIALDEQIREHEVALARLKRARNSLLNISKLLPEVLGQIFSWNVTLRDDFGGLGEESHNFLLVCHHWFEVASSTPEVWSFWGSAPKDWARWYHRSRTAPLDLVLNVIDDDGSFGPTLSDVLQDRANLDTVRRIHLRAADTELLGAIISSLTASSSELQPSGMESLILQNDSNGSVDISGFFSRHRFPRLRRLELFDCTISSWDLIVSRTTALTTLGLNLHTTKPTPTTIQVLSILTSNPTLQKISLSGYWVAGGGGGGGNPSPRVSLHHLKDLELDGDPQCVFGFLSRLDHPRHLDRLFVALDPCVVEDISRFIGPYLQDHVQRRGRSQSGLGLTLRLPYDDFITLHIGDVGRMDFSAPVPAQMKPFVTISIELNQRVFADLWQKVALNLIAHTPREEIVYFQACGELMTTEDISIQFPNLRGLHFERTPLHTAFPRSNLDRAGKIFPSLQYVFLDRVIVDDGDWDPLTTFLDYRVSSGNRLHTLVHVGAYHMNPAVQRILEGLVQKFAYV